MKQCIFISGNDVNDIWLTSLLEVYSEGIDMKTEYDKSNEPPSKDATVMIEIENPLDNPIQRNGKVLEIKTKYNNRYKVYGNIADTYLIGSIQSGYIEEMMVGVNDHLIIESKTSFPYTYHDRLFNYRAYSDEDRKDRYYSIFVDIRDPRTTDIRDWRSPIFEFPSVDQIKYIIDKLNESDYSRRAQAITWRPYADPFRDDPPCLQRIWCRIIDNKLVMETMWRSRDLFRAWSANVNAMIQLQNAIAKQLNVEIGTYIDFSNSLHIYGNKIKEFKELLERMYNKWKLGKIMIKDCNLKKIEIMKEKEIKICGSNDVYETVSLVCNDIYKGFYNIIIKFYNHNIDKVAVFKSETSYDKQELIALNKLIKELV